MVFGVVLLMFSSVVWILHCLARVGHCFEFLCTSGVMYFRIEILLSLVVSIVPNSDYSDVVRRLPFQWIRVPIFQVLMPLRHLFFHHVG
jgi:hypothetical protein